MSNRSAFATAVHRGHGYALRRLITLLIIILVLQGCGSDESASPDPGATTSPSDTTTSDETTSDQTASDSSDTSAPTTSGSDSTEPDSTAPDSTEPDPAPLTVEEVLETRPDGVVTVAGSYIDQGAGPLLCEALAESFPPQCGGRWMVLIGPSLDAIDVVIEGEVMWSDQTVEFSGALEGDRFVIGDPDGAAPTSHDRAIVEAFVDLARSPADIDPGDLPIAEQGLQLGLADQLLAVRTATALADPAAWLVDLEAFRGWVGPFSALDMLSRDRPTEILVGPHNHCASPPTRAPEGFGDLRRLSVSPTDATSCLEWWTVDFFVDDDGFVSAITLDLWEP